MTTDDLKQYFGSVTKASKAIGIHRVTIYHWGREGKIPKDVQGYIYYLTNGALKPDFPSLP